MIHFVLINASELLNCAPNVVVTGLKYKNGKHDLKLICGNGEIEGLNVDRTGNSLWGHESSSVVNCDANTVMTSVETSSGFRVGCSRLERLKDSNVVPETTSTCVEVAINDDSSVKCPSGYVGRGIKTTKSHIASIFCCLITTPSTTGPVPTTKAWVAPPIGAVLPSAIVVNGQNIGPAPVISQGQQQPSLDPSLGTPGPSNTLSGQMGLPNVDPVAMSDQRQQQNLIQDGQAGATNGFSTSLSSGMAPSNLFPNQFMPNSAPQNQGSGDQLSPISFPNAPLS
eukprot:NODE_649_length_5036_cov_1.140571.p2 type:complete len:283 gc:universal NODE_649_length_5036_cov_1.140571:263-1111(+)